MIRGPEFVSRGQPEGGCPLRNSGALTIGSNFAVRATRVEDSRRFLRELDEAPGGNNLYYIYYSVLVSVRATRHQTPGESLVDITDCNYNTTHLRENPQRLG